MEDVTELEPEEMQECPTEEAAEDITFDEDIVIDEAEDEELDLHLPVNKSRLLGIFILVVSVVVLIFVGRLISKRDTYGYDTYNEVYNFLEDH